ALPANSVRKTPLPMRIIATKGYKSRMTYAGREAPKLVQRLEEYFGIPFPYPKLDLIASPLEGGAMENAGAIIFDDRLLLFDDHPTAREQSIFGVVAAHEMAHQWFGDLVTPAWWDDIWLNESFAEWMAPKAGDVVLPDQGFATDTLRGGIEVMNLDEEPSARQIHQPIKNVDDLANAFDSITYDKGASV